jgi:ribonuclease Z
MAGRTAPLTLIAPPSVAQWLQVTRTLTDAPLPYEVRHVDADAWDWQTGPSSALRIERHALLHRVPSHAFRIEATQTHAHLCIVIGGDNADPTLLRAACADAQLLVHEATFTQAALDKVGPGPMHSSARMIAAFAESVALPNLILTHLSARHQNAEGLAALREEAAAHYHGALWIANDFDVFTLDAQGALTAVE